MLYLTKSSSKSEFNERSRSGANYAAANCRKKLGPSMSLEEHSQVKVIDRSEPDGRISVQRWQLNERKIIFEIARNKGDIESVTFKDPICHSGGTLLSV